MSGEFVGNNRNFVVAAISDVVIYFNKIGNDTDTEKYGHPSDQSKAQSARRLSLRTDQTIEILEENGMAFTDPVTVILNTEYVERRDLALVVSMKIRTTVANTSIKIRWHGGY